MCCVSSLILQSFLDSKVVHVKIIALHFGLYGLKLDRRSGRIEILQTCFISIYEYPSLYISGGLGKMCNTYKDNETGLELDCT